VVGEGKMFRVSKEGVGETHSPLNPRPYLISIVGSIIGGRLRMGFNYSRDVFERESIERLAKSYGRHLRSLIAHCTSVKPESQGDDGLVMDLNREDIELALVEFEFEERA
jgi:non-ribosomal peptide synthase protein (TIGR01720 family)